MRKINTRHFRLATRRTPRDINRQIVLNLIREHQPISRAELSRRMEVPRSALTTIVRELVDNGSVQEVGTAMAVRGRRPTLLRIRSGGRLIAAADVRAGHTRIALTDFEGKPVASESFATPRAPEELVELLADSVMRMLREHGAVDAPAAGEVPASDDPFAEPAAADAATDQVAQEPQRSCIGVGLVVPGMVDRRTRRVLYAPRLGWRDVALHEAISTRLGLPVHVEGAPVACALARLWHSPEETRDVRSFAYVSVSDGIGVGLVMNGDAIRGEAHTAGEFGHVTLDPSGPACACGKKGCFEAFACNSATIARYVDGVRGPATAANGRRGRVASAITIEEVVRRAREGEVAAIAALEETGTQLGRGLAAVVSAFNPGRIYVGGEVTAAWDIIEGPMRTALVAETLTAAAHATPIVPDRNPAEYRLLGAVALVAAPEFAAPSLG